MRRPWAESRGAAGDDDEENRADQQHHDQCDGYHRTVHGLRPPRVGIPITLADVRADVPRTHSMASMQIGRRMCRDIDTSDQQGLTSADRQYLRCVGYVSGCRAIAAEVDPRGRRSPVVRGWPRCPVRPRPGTGQTPTGARSPERRAVRACSARAAAPGCPAISIAPQRVRTSTLAFSDATQPARSIAW